MYMRLLIENCPYHNRRLTQTSWAESLKSYLENSLKRLLKLLLLHVQWQHTYISMLVRRAEYSNLLLATCTMWTCVVPSPRSFLPAWELLPFGCFFLVSQAKSKQQNGVSNQPLLELVFDDAGESVDKVEAKAKSLVHATKNSLKTC